jgi:glycosyltransferase involved in cell wall biosynthesis
MAMSGDGTTVSDVRVLEPAPNVSVIVPVFNGLPHLRTQMDRLLSQECDFRWEALYVDNGSTDGSREEIQEAIRTHNDRTIRLVDGSDKAGQVHARNIGAAAARADNLVFTDQDDLPEAGWLSHLVRGLDRADAVGGFVQLTDHGQSPRPGLRPAENALPLLFGRFPIALGTSFAIKKKTLQAVGGWRDTGVFAGEDVDLCIRLQLGNFDLDYAPEARLTWRSRADLRGVFRQGFTYGRADVLLFVRYRHVGATRRGLRMVWSSWKNIARELLRLTFRRSDSLVGVHQLGWALGHVEQSITSRVLYL